DTSLASYAYRVDSASVRFSVRQQSESAFWFLRQNEVEFSFLSPDTLRTQNTPAFYSGYLVDGRDSSYYRRSSDWKYTYSILKKIDVSVTLDTFNIVMRDTLNLDTIVEVANCDTVSRVPLVLDMCDTLYPIVKRDFVVYYNRDSVNGADTTFDTLYNEWLEGSFSGTVWRARKIDSLNNTVFRDTIPSADANHYYATATINKLDKTDNIFVAADTLTTLRRFLGTYQYYAFKTPGSFPSNPYRLRDMTGNASEWCWDGYVEADRRYRVNDRVNTGITRVRKGGDCTSGSLGDAPLGHLENGNRTSLNPSVSDPGTGFRVVRRAP
ncbi:MAG: SUMF1/EgtB/PvdO family nonheme iron enzyme, partial [Fibrobacterota bacterium]